MRKMGSPRAYCERADRTDDAAGKLEITLNSIAACARPSSAEGLFDAESRLLPVHPHHVGGTHDLATIDVDGGLKQIFI